MRFILIATLLVAALAMCACSSKPRAPKTDPFLASKQDFQRGVRVLAVAPVVIPDGLPDPAPVTNTFASLIDETLRRHGFSVVRPQEYEKTWLTIAGGGFIDSTTGERDEVAMTRAMIRTLESLGADFDIEGILFPSIVVVEAPFGAGSAAWDGVEQRVETGDAMTRFFAGSQRGVIDALSLKVTIRSPEGDAVFVNLGGIEVLSKMVGKEFTTVPRQELFTDEERNRKAVETALKPLAR